MTADAGNEPPPKRATHEVAGVLSALGKLMKQLRDQDLALQNAVSELASKSTAAGEQLVHIQHIDLITQTHEDLAQFLPELAACLESTNFDEGKLTQRLRMQSLKDQLLDAELEPTPTNPGDLLLF